MTPANISQVGGSHYKVDGLQHWDMIHDNAVGYLAGNATKYLTRFRRKHGLQDLEKALHYVEKMIEKSATFQDSLFGSVPEEQIITFLGDNAITGVEREPIRLILSYRSVSDLRVAKTWIGSLIAEFDGSGASSSYVKQD